MPTITNFGGNSGGSTWEYMYASVRNNSGNSYITAGKNGVVYCTGSPYGDNPGIIQGSNDASSWTTIASGGGGYNNGGGVFGTNNDYKYYRATYSKSAGTAFVATLK